MFFLISTNLKGREDFGIRPFDMCGKVICIIICIKYFSKRVSIAVCITSRNNFNVQFYVITLL